MREGRKVSAIVHDQFAKGEEEGFASLSLSYCVCVTITPESWRERKIYTTTVASKSNKMALKADGRAGRSLMHARFCLRAMPGQILPLPTGAKSSCGASISYCWHDASSPVARPLICV